MSYDISIGSEWLNYTCNGSAIFYDHMPATDDCDQGGLWTLHGKTGAEAARLIANAWDRLDQTRHGLWKADDVGEPELCKRYDSPNGWGSTIGAMMFLARIQARCIRNPRARVKVAA